MLAKWIAVHSFAASVNCPYNGVKAVPLQAWTGPEGSRKLRLPDFKKITTLRW
jgi:hypothetical protein